MYASGKLLRETFGDTTLDFFYSTSGQPYALKHNGTTYYYITNLQGDVMQIVNGDGEVVASYQYDPYGNIISATGALAEINPLRYRGYIYDPECNLYYLQSRYYDPSIGRFLNADAFASTGQGILGHNMFAYCLNNPVNYSDKTGMVVEDWADWAGELLGELLYELLSGNDHPSHQTRELENQVRQKQNAFLGNGLKAIGSGFKSVWDAYMRGYALEQEAQRQEANMNIYSFSTPERVKKSFNAMGSELSLIGVFWGGALVQGAAGLFLLIAAIIDA